jgi:hypothetical protein
LGEEKLKTFLTESFPDIILDQQVDVCRNVLTGRKLKMDFGIPSDSFEVLSKYLGADIGQDTPVYIALELDGKTHFSGSYNQKEDYEMYIGHDVKKEVSACLKNWRVIRVSWLSVYHDTNDWKQFVKDALKFALETPLGPMIVHEDLACYVPDKECPENMKMYVIARDRSDSAFRGVFRSPSLPNGCYRPFVECPASSSSSSREAPHCTIELSEENPHKKARTS